MVEINLLPWRMQKQHYEQTILLRYLLAGMAMALIMVTASHVWLAKKNEAQAMRVKAMRMRLPDEQTSVENGPDNKGPDYFSATDVLALFVAAASDQRVCYSQLIRDQDGITLTGYARSLLGVTHVLRSLSGAKVMSHLQLSEVKKSVDSDSLQFVLNAREA